MKRIHRILVEMRGNVLILIASVLFMGSVASDIRNITCILPAELSSTVPVIFAPEFISTHMSERDAALSPDRNEFYYTVSGYIHSVIVFSEKTPEGWTRPQVAPFSGVYADLEPHFSHDGQRLYFASNRPFEEGGETKDFDIWYVDRMGKVWSEPVNIGSPVNTEDDEFYPSITTGGTLYWCAKRSDGIGPGREDIYYSALENGKYKTVHALPDSINTIGDEFNAYVARDESYIIFTSNGWGRGFGRGDLWISFKHPDGHWTKAKNMGDKVNSSSFDYCPFVSDCGRYLFFTSDRVSENSNQPPATYRDILDFSLKPGNKQNSIYIMDAGIISELRKDVF